MPFLNLPLLSWGWFYLEQLGVSRFLLNTYLFPEKLRNTVDFLSQAEQKISIFPEDKPLGGAGTLYKLKNELKKTEQFFYINGDSLFFPSHLKQLTAFEEDFLNTSATASFFSSPLENQQPYSSALWCDQDMNLKFIGVKEKIPKKLVPDKLSPFYFSGFALMKSSLLEHLKAKDFHLFEDFIQPLLTKEKIKVFADKEAKILEAGEIEAYLKSTRFCLNILFGLNSSNKKELKPSSAQELNKLFKKCFLRFDSKDQIVGLENGKAYSKKLAFPLLAPKSVKGLEYLKLEGSAVLGPEVHLFGKTCLKEVVLGAKLSWRGNLENKIILKS